MTPAGNVISVKTTTLRCSPIYRYLVIELVRALSEAHTAVTVVQTTFENVANLKRLEIGWLTDVWICTGPIHREPRAVSTQPPRGSHALGDGQGYAAFTFSKVPSEASLRLLCALVTSSFRHVDLVSRVASLSRRAQQDSVQLTEALSDAILPEGIVAVSRTMREVLYDLVPLVARQDTTVLLRGETGTGKEVIARGIHAASRRSNRPFLKVNCGALPEQLVESVLFGHERGAFTGATARHLGVFERANGGTLLLDEVAELSLSAQVKLLRVLQDGDFERVGAERAIEVDVRVVAATHRALEELVERGAFRKDLYYRLNVFPIFLPPLRDRVEDIGPLAHAILRRLAQQMRRAPPRLTTPVLTRLQNHHWPGNVRELENVIERALLLTNGDTLAAPELGPRSSIDTRTTKSTDSLDDSIREAITAALHACDGRIFGPRGAAVRLGLKPTTLQSKLKRLGVPRSVRQ